MTSAAAAVLSRRALNRALLERQLLLGRAAMPAVKAVEHLGGMQAQAPNAPYIGLWTRLQDFQHGELSGLLLGKRVVRMALLRGTIHLVSAEDASTWRLPLQPVLDRQFQSNFGRRLVGLDRDALVAAAETLLADRPLTFSQLGALLAERWPQYDPADLGYAVRTWVPLVQVPPRGLWGASGLALHAAAGAWLQQPTEQCSTPDQLILRYLTAFGPATVPDMQTWSGLTGLREVAERLRPDLQTFRDEHGRELFDLSEAPRPDADVSAPVRFLPPFDNVLLSHADRTRILDVKMRRELFGLNGVMPGTILVDGFIRGTWKIERGGDSAVLRIHADGPLTDVDGVGIEEEGTRLLDFAAAGTAHREVWLQ